MCSDSLPRTPLTAISLSTSCFPTWMLTTPDAQRLFHARLRVHHLPECSFCNLLPMLCLNLHGEETVSVIMCCWSHRMHDSSMHPAFKNIQRYAKLNDTTIRNRQKVYVSYPGGWQAVTCASGHWQHAGSMGHDSAAQRAFCCSSRSFCMTSGRVPISLKSRMSVAALVSCPAATSDVMPL